ncbi:MAG: hypothetical protein COW01_03015 [Bdellovibrionales bacterium CG12_big_fil_rev_8_21_14_0_65_38_15]|nr:MAG: hypothetical protein COW79_12255 [Bdellovibrionales bacterium CG22_combo_CG10-13_8_21_14_all_38_13]PIQ56818.1 MAG: hypothetical protein COW01_03015 [Bdellovibrionales bacterium CG12_big_fil_rev_8_21_14_0_65_38_15]PIR28539.1 MAG: hypothetical protein COV38_15290 [Bdellovibrionales bacterium CG11_big_fil_rev_8_21_14_0_20_38_13]
MRFAQPIGHRKTLEIFWTKEIDCEKESESALTTIANALFYLNYEEPLSYEVKLPIRDNEKALENKLLGPEITSFINPETVERDREHNRQRSIKARKYQNLKSPWNTYC